MLAYLRDGSAQTVCSAETEPADQTCYLCRSSYTDTEPTSPNADPIAPSIRQFVSEVVGAWYPRKKTQRIKVSAIPSKQYLLIEHGATHSVFINFDVS